MDQTGIPHLMQLLRDKWQEQHGRTLPKEAEDFSLWCENYLNEHRTVENWPADSNIGVRLSNNERAVIHPNAPASGGTMQDSGAVSVTEGQTQPGQEGVVQVNDQQRVI